MINRLGVCNYHIDIRAGDRGKLVVEFNLPIGSLYMDSDKAAETLGAIGRWLHSGKVSLVSAENYTYCFYCGKKNELDALECIGCGGTL